MFIGHFGVGCAARRMPRRSPWAFMAGVWLYVRATPAMDRTGRWALAGLVTFFALLAAQYFYGPPPPNLASVSEPAAAVRLAGAA
jgi:hypothetical protein